MKEKVRDTIYLLLHLLPQWGNSTTDLIVLFGFLFDVYIYQ